MSNLFGTMRASLSALQTIQDNLTVTQNNVTNASAPGYARQRLGLRALEFDPATGMAGGLASSGLVSSRDEHAETMVRSEVSMLEEVKATLSSFTKLESVISLNDESGIPSKLNKLLSAFSAWSVAPASAAAKENVYAAAVEVAGSFNRTAESLDRLSANSQNQIATDLKAINNLAEEVRQFNQSRRTGSRADAGLDAGLHVALESLSELVDIRTIWQEDGTVTVLAGGEAALVVGDHRYELQVQYYNDDPSPLYPEAPPAAHISTEGGADITEHLSGGRLTSSVRFRNEDLPYLAGTTQTPGDVNRLAKAVADRVNSILASGYPPPHEPYHLFVYGASAVSIAQSIQVNPTLAPALLSATDPLAIPPTVNGKALQLAKLANPVAPEDMLDGMSFVGFFGKMSADVGRQVTAAKKETESREQLTAQARNMRAQSSGVSFDEEAVQLVQLQHAYQATAQMISTVDNILELALSLKR